MILCPLLAGCGTGIGDKLPPLTVNISQDCERLATTVAHYPYVPGKTDARTAWRGEKNRLTTANEHLVATRDCQAKQREQYGTATR